MSKYTPIIYKGNYITRQKQANNDRCICYVEQHLNASINLGANGIFCVVGANASETSKKWARLYSNEIVTTYPLITKLGGPTGDGVWVGGYMGRGNNNLKFTHMPSILCESLYLSNPRHHPILKSEQELEKIANILVKSIVVMFPQGGKVGLSVGHLYKVANPTDKGAYDPAVGYEGTFCDKIINYTKKGLEKIC